MSFSTYRVGSGTSTRQDWTNTSSHKMSEMIPRIKAIFLCSVGSEFCDLVWDLFSPTDPTEDGVSYAQLLTRLKTHLVPTNVEIAERFKFYQRKQKEEESIKDFEGALWNLAKYCVFGTFPDSALRDAFVIGLFDNNIQTKLLTEESLTLAAAITKAQGMEAASSQSKQLRNKEPTLDGVKFYRGLRRLLEVWFLMPPQR